MKRVLQYLLLLVVSVVTVPSLADDDVATEISMLDKGLAERQEEMAGYFYRGALGMMSNGLIGIRNIYRLNEDAQLDARKLTALENRDRTRLYMLVGGDNIEIIRQQAVERWVSEAKTGWWYRDASGKWNKK